MGETIADVYVSYRFVRWDDGGGLTYDEIDEETSKDTTKFKQWMRSICCVLEDKYLNPELKKLQEILSGEGVIHEK